MRPVKRCANCSHFVPSDRPQNATAPQHSNTPEPKTGPTPGRRSNGQFAAGNPGGPGNPFARKAAHFKKIFQKVATDDEIRALARKLLEMGLEGDKHAAKLYAQYAMTAETAAMRR